MTENKTTFVLGSGVNASHWLAQHFEGIPPKDVFFTQKDVQFLKEAGFQHLRIPVEEKEMWNEDGSPNEESFDYLDKALKWAKDAGMTAILDLHIVKSHHFNAENEKGDHKNTLFTSDAAQQHLIDMWMEFSERYHQWPNDFLAYEILNEAVAEDNEDWNKLIAKCIKAIREKEPNRYIVVGANRWQQCQFFPYLKVPEGDKNIILSFHFYHPFAFTHYQAGWTGPMAQYNGPINYPGNLVPEDYLKSMPEGPVKETIKAEYYNDKETLREIMRPAIEYAKKHGLELYCGEWGTMPSMPEEMRLKWYSDMSEIFAEEGIENAIWSYKVEFGIRSNDGKTTDNALIKAILSGNK
jgi:endoglucanase